MIEKEINNSTKNDLFIQKEHAFFDKTISGVIGIVDDNMMNITLLEEILSEFPNFEIHSYQKPELLLKELNQIDFDLFLLDILMPTMTGFELTEKIKLNQYNETTPIVFISALSDTEQKLSAYNLGAYSYIEKPYDINLVKTQIYNLIKNINEQKIEEKTKDNFVAMLTHDLKSPINAEIQALELLIRKSFGQISETQNEVLGGILNSAKYMKQITDKILCHYKQKNGTLELKKENYPLNILITESINEMDFLFKEKNQKIIFNNNTQTSNTFIDTIEIKRVLTNILSNAIEYSPQNGEINVELDNNKDFFVIKIKDSGYGVDMGICSNIFDEYMSLAKEQKRIGFGLGLHICKIIIEAHNGIIKMFSEKGKGTTIEFSIPATLL